ncbi:hypothetical protein [Ewingella americana]|uniref:Uncharacterized protein n=1 Tax=Ewingella americana TaxID=41202 RepID=A0A502GGL8_9GAMM|nr:hypothetical protein [Ewingella americana]TPG60106.1 hypothetical protein EAH77_16185 [Ewingella americana]
MLKFSQLNGGMEATKNLSEVPNTTQALKNLRAFRSVYGQKGEVLSLSSDGSLVVTPLVSQVRIATTDAELASEKNNIVGFKEIFDTWPQISIGQLFDKTIETVPEELNIWDYDATTGNVYVTTDTVSQIGFITPKSYASYIFEVRLKSFTADTAKSQGDFIGVILAYQKDEHGIQHTLTAFRTLQGGISPNYSGTPGKNDLFSWNVVYNAAYGGFSINTPEDWAAYGKGRYIVAEGSQSIKFVAGADGRTNPFYGPSPRQAEWSDQPSWANFPNGCKVKAIRTGNIITAVTSDFDNPEVYVDASTLTIDLDSDPRLAIFKGSSALGYTAWSQPYCSFDTLMFSGGKNIIVDARTKEVWSYNGTAWVLAPEISILNLISIGKFAYNPSTSKLYFCNSDLKLEEVSI